MLETIENLAGAVWKVLGTLLYWALVLGIPVLIIYGLYKLGQFIIEKPKEAAERICINFDDLPGGYKNVTLAQATMTCDPSIVSQCEALLDASNLIEDKCSKRFCEAYNIAINCFCRRCGCFRECEMDLKEEVCPEICNNYKLGLA